MAQDKREQKLIRKDVFQISTTSIESVTAGATYTATEQALLNDIKTLLTQLIHNGKGS